jgi:hypothetical protein
MNHQPLTAAEKEVMAIANNISHRAGNDGSGIWGILFEVSAMIGDDRPGIETFNAYRPESRQIRRRFAEAATTHDLTETDVMRMVSREIIRMEWEDKAATAAMLEGEEMLR